VVCAGRVVRAQTVEDLPGRAEQDEGVDQLVAALVGDVTGGEPFAQQIVRVVAQRQSCASLTRVIVSRARHDEFVDALAASFEATRVGSAFDPATQLGPLVSAGQRDRVESYIAEARASDARLVTGGGRPADLPRGYFVEPTVFAEVDNSSKIAQEEVFGPVLAVIPAADEADAVRIANDTIYGLNASVFTPDVDRARGVAAQLRSGTVGHNAFRLDARIGFGGFKQSGLGREGGREGIAAYSETKVIVLDEPPQGYR